MPHGALDVRQTEVLVRGQCGLFALDTGDEPGERFGGPQPHP
ncbi:hypothetical protein BZZ08_07158 [Streptomyces sp. MH60]|nr:hypothetical protein BZZ08_07158 [Streptomyces sp. MH60]